MEKLNKSINLTATVTEKDFFSKEKNEHITYYVLTLDVGGETFRCKVDDNDKRYFKHLIKMALSTEKE